MSPDATTGELHSVQWLSDQNRDYWWNRDHLQLIAARWGLERATNMLDVGCGMGHWTFLLASVLQETVEVTGVDLEVQWLEAARECAESAGISDRFRFQQGNVMALDFPDASFDLVTCQTLMMHLPDPQAAVRELLRVTKPGGLIMCAEPNCLSALTTLSSTNAEVPVEDFLDLLRFGLFCERGKAALGEGNDSVGNLLPGYLAAAGAVEIESFASDKTHALLPPYESDEQRALRDYYIDGIETMLWPREKARRYFLAGGGSADEFEAAWERRERECDRDAEAIRDLRFHTTGGWVLYLIAARRPQ